MEDMKLALKISSIVKFLKENKLTVDFCMRSSINSGQLAVIGRDPVGLVDGYRSFMLRVVKDFNKYKHANKE